MASLVIGIRYLTGYAVATNPASRKRPEWPPHPARVFMALAAAHFVTGEDAEEAQALQWLEQLPHPVLYASEANKRKIVTVYVPVNDKPIGSGTLQSVVGLTRTKQPRTFPCVRPHDERVYVVWRDIQTKAWISVLERLCRKVTRIGHSSSLVQMWVADGVPEEVEGFCWEPDELEGEAQLRILSPGSLEYLKEQYGAQIRKDHHLLKDQIRLLEAEKRAIKGSNNRKRKAAIQQDIAELKVGLSKKQPRDPLRPVMSLWGGYRRARSELDSVVADTVWDPNLIVRRLVPVESHHRRLDLIAALKVTVAMHKAVITKLNRSVPEFISGHSPDGSPTEIPHLAYLPLPFLGTKYAKGHIMGVAVAVPKELDRGQRRLALATVGQVQELTMGPLGRWKLELDDLGKFNLRPDVWTGGTDGATKWATVTPIALDRHPKARDRNERESELIGIIEEGCRRIGLDTPVQVIITAISPHFGTSAAHDFPPMRRKDGSLRRHVHAILIFDRPVRGPIVLGAGRYRGYGFCRPLLASEVF